MKKPFGKKLGSLFAVGVLATSLLTACGEKEEGTTNNGGSSDSETIKIGAVLPMTGGAAVFGEKFEQAYTMAVEDINANGGVDGKKLEMVIEDSQSKPQVGKVATEKLISDKDILAVTGGRSSGVTLVVAQVAEDNQIPYVIDHGSSDKATLSGYEYVYRMNPTAGMYTSALRDYFKENPPASIAYVNVDNAFGEAVYEYGVKKYVDESGVKFEQYKYKAGELDLKPIMQKVKAFQPEVVLMTAGDDNDATQIMKAAKEAGVSAEMFVGTSAGHAIVGFAKQAGDLSETVLTAGPWHGDKNSEEWQTFRERFVEKYDHEPGEHEVEAYSVIYVLADALERAESLDRESMKNAIEETDIKTIFGQVKFEDFDGYTNQNKGMTEVAQWIDGEMHTVYPKEYAQKEWVEFKGW